MEFIISIIIIVVVIYFFANVSNVKNQLSPDSKVKKNSNSNFGSKTKMSGGRFSISGYHHLSDDAKKLVWKGLKVGDELSLKPDPSNEFDNNAIKILFRDTHIGWVPKDYSRKGELFNALQSNMSIKIICTENIRRQDLIRASRPDKDGIWNDKYLGMAQFVSVKYEYK
jgi:hypothetical protein